MPALHQINDIDQPGDGAWALASSVSSQAGAREGQPAQRAGGSLCAVLQDWAVAVSLQGRRDRWRCRRVRVPRGGGLTLVGPPARTATPQVLGPASGV